PGGYFNGPFGEERVGIYGAAPRYTSNLLREIANTGAVPEIGENWRAQARYDFAYWKAGVLVLGPQVHQDALRQAVDELVGHPGTFTGGAWVWDLDGSGRYSPS
ncbi:glycosyltransferase family 2 protein, partial [Streptomyces sp. NPDC005568]